MTLQVLRLVTMVVAAGLIPKLIGWQARRASRATEVSQTVERPAAVAC